MFTERSQFAHTDGVIHKPSFGRESQPTLFRLFVFLCLLLLCILAVGTYWTPTDTSRIVSSVFLQHISAAECPNVLTGMTKGKWIIRPLSKIEEKQISLFLITARSHYGVSASMERADKQCGNVGFPGLHSHAKLKFRALCDPVGNTPCCDNYRCVNKSTESCSCPRCFDARREIHAEYAKWRPRDSRCQLRTYTAPHACDLLSGSKLYFVGDSYLRQMYVMMVMHLTDNYKDSALLPNTPSDCEFDSKTRLSQIPSGKAARKRYYGPFQLLCHRHLNRNKIVCNQSSLSHNEIVVPNQVKYVLGLVHTLRNTSRSVVLLGQGIHSGYDAQSTWNRFLRPVLELYLRTKQTWPKLIWVAPHAHGILKIPRNPQQSDESLRKFNDFINDKLNKWNVSFFDTLPMTQGVMAYDGAHYGTGVNMVKIQVIYNYLQDLKNKQMW